jgi:hypothetical protein
MSFCLPISWLTWILLSEGETTKFHKLLFMKSVLDEHLEEEKPEQVEGTLH